MNVVPIETQRSIRTGRAVWVFILAYIAITVAATAFSIAIATAMHVPQGFAPLENPAYILAQRFIPILNLLVWTAFAWIYFQGKTITASSGSKEALHLGVVWLGLAMLVDLVCFVLIKNPISLSPHDFYIGQFPWIYLTYAAVLASPYCALHLKNRAHKAPASIPL